MIPAAALRPSPIWKVMINGIDKKGFIAVKSGNEVWFTPKPKTLLIIVR